MSTVQTTPINLQSSPATPARQCGWLGWAVFLGISWTWCIGMFLPVLLVRDYGIWGWVVFAVPNVLGAAAMGWVLRSADRSIALVREHHEACALFSAVTIAFHLFFVLGVLSPVAAAVAPGQSSDLAVGGVLVIGIAMFLLMTGTSGADRVLACVALGISAAAMIWVIVDIVRTPADFPQLGRPFSRDLLWLAPVCIFGFAACPYLDLTFHRAHQSTPRPRASFGVGFGAVFMLMIVFTLIYSRAINQPWSATLSALLLIHMGVQSAFTVAAHARELRVNGVRAIVAATVLTLAAWAALLLLRRGDVVSHMSAGELIYRIFMGFYGLVFPAYVWLVVLPRGGASRAKLLVYALATLAALPMFWMGFVMRERMIWLVPGLAIVLLARLTIPGGYAKRGAL